MSDKAKARARIVFARVAGTLDDWSWAANGETIIAAALAAEREAGWRAGVEAAREEACKHTGWAPSSERWTVAAEIEAAIRALPYPTPAQEGGDATSQVEPQSTPASYDDAPAVTSGGGQPAEVEVAQEILSGAEFNGMDYVAKAQKVARALLAERAAREAAERDRDDNFVPKSWLAHSKKKLGDTKARVAELTAEVERLRAALEPFAKFARVWRARPMVGIDDVVYSIHRNTEYEAELRRSDCERARAALEAGR